MSWKLVHFWKSKRHKSQDFNPTKKVEYISHAFTLCNKFGKVELCATSCAFRRKKKQDIHCIHTIRGHVNWYSTLTMQNFLKWPHSILFYWKGARRFWFSLNLIKSMQNGEDGRNSVHIFTKISIFSTKKSHITLNTWGQNLTKKKKILQLQEAVEPCWFSRNTDGCSTFVIFYWI